MRDKHRPEQAVTIFVKLICCSACRSRLKKEDVLTKSGWRQMATFAMEKHQLQAAWKTAGLAFAAL